MDIKQRGREKGINLEGGRRRREGERGGERVKNMKRLTDTGRSKFFHRFSIKAREAGHARRHRWNVFTEPEREAGEHSRQGQRTNNGRKS